MAPQVPQIDVVIGEVRVVINPNTGLIGLHRDDESITLVRQEAYRIGQLFIEHCRGVGDQD